MRFRYWALWTLCWVGARYRNIVNKVQTWIICILVNISLVLLFYNLNNQQIRGSDKGVSPFHKRTLLKRLHPLEALPRGYSEASLVFSTSVQVEGSHRVMNLLRRTLNGVEAEESMWILCGDAHVRICISIYIYCHVLLYIILYYVISYTCWYVKNSQNMYTYTTKRLKFTDKIWVFFTLQPPNERIPGFFHHRPRCKSRCTMFLEWMCILGFLRWFGPWWLTGLPLGFSRRTTRSKLQSIHNLQKDVASLFVIHMASNSNWTDSYKKTDRKKTKNTLCEDVEIVGVFGIREWPNPWTYQGVCFSRHWDNCKIHTVV